MVVGPNTECHRPETGTRESPENDREESSAYTATAMVRIDDEAVDPRCSDALLAHVTEADRHPVSLGEPEPEPWLVSVHVGVGNGQGNEVRSVPVGTIVKR